MYYQFNYKQKHAKYYYWLRYVLLLITYVLKQKINIL